MPYEIIKLETFEPNVPIYGWIDGVPVQDNAWVQLSNLSQIPFIHHHIAVMPDVHWGCGATIGSVIPTVGAVIPAAVGVDIGCGMMAVKTSLTASDLPDNLNGIRTSIEAAVPHGRTDNGGLNDKGAHSQDNIQACLPTLAEQHLLAKLWTDIVPKHPDLAKAAKRALNHLGTLGTGNHFIELCLDESDNVWIMLHSGSRGIGNKIGMYFIEKAKEDMRRWFINLPDADLAYLPEGSPFFDDYIEAVEWAQNFAAENRRDMMQTVLTVLHTYFNKDILYTDTAINCHHNYVTKENHYGKNVWLTRKGAVRARAGDLGIIPGSMGTKSFIVRGLGNPASFNTCSHGAGRVMSRAEANKKITLKQHLKDTEGVECRKDASVIDESPSAYKDIDAVMDVQSDLVEIVHTLKQVLCVKG